MKPQILFTLILTLLNFTNSNSKDVGLLDNLLGKNKNSDQTSEMKIDTTHLEKTSEMLEEDKFWEIISKSLKSTSDQDAQEQHLISEIQKLTPKRLLVFG